MNPIDQTELEVRNEQLRLQAKFLKATAEKLLGRGEFATPTCLDTAPPERLAEQNNGLETYIASLQNIISQEADPQARRSNIRAPDATAPAAPAPAPAVAPAQSRTDRLVELESDAKYLELKINVLHCHDHPKRPPVDPANIDASLTALEKHIVALKAIDELACARKKAKPQPKTSPSPSPAAQVDHVTGATKAAFEREGVTSFSALSAKLKANPRNFSLPRR